MAAVSVALDWTPNTNHAGKQRKDNARTDCRLLISDCPSKQHAFFSAGFYVALAQGLYKSANLTVDFLNPVHDNYKATPASRVASGQATFAVTPSETVVSYNSQPPSSTKPRLTVRGHAVIGMNVTTVSFDVFQPIRHCPNQQSGVQSSQIPSS